REAVGVVVERDRPAEPPLEIGAERAAVDAHGVCVLGEPAAPRGAAGHADADGDGARIEAGRAGRLLDDACGRRGPRGVSFGGGWGDAAAREDLDWEGRGAASNEAAREDGFHLRAAEIDGDDVIGSALRLGLRG